MSRPASYPYPNWLFTEQQLRAIGAVAFESAYLERVLDDLTIYALGINREGLKLIVREKSQLKSKADFLYAVLKAKLKAPRHISEFNTLYADIKSAIHDRNMIIHGEWLTGVQSWLAGYSKHYAAEPLTARKSDKADQPNILKASKIEKTAFNLWDASDRLKAFREKNPLRIRALRGKAAQ